MKPRLLRSMSTKERLEREFLVLCTIDQVRAGGFPSAGVFLEDAVLDTELRFLEIDTTLADVDARLKLTPAALPDSPS